MITYLLAYIHTYIYILHAYFLHAKMNTYIYIYVFIRINKHINIFLNSHRHSLSDDNFRAPQYSSTTTSSARTLPPCYPEVYEGFLGIQEILEKISQIAAPNK